MWGATGTYSDIYDDFYLVLFPVEFREYSDEDREDHNCVELRSCIGDLKVVGERHVIYLDDWCVIYYGVCTRSQKEIGLAASKNRGFDFSDMACRFRPRNI